ncbi:phosphate propanoyltransferase [Clostridium botulinum]|uniref:Phosphate propanoyltransferase n=1 Tax=Clostridium botulinum (strain Eklund 17B / Type B) TaxID=935198 RepID=B2TJS7_CLOBB|nr:propanediol utilization protein [Clostridium botulinum B str. Eklund 17B (NRP)]MBY6974722.1 phosphate propanoyltransferase [Clostridium botulinum]MBY6999708.1 phosphate propanoyltransferase [Clostridium botulinum]MCR1275059.1 phosphate propanoyltransferase [Clostridium botulinum]NFD70690.1 phosphate propanoyltransferase [Clostridium botulinum]
MDECEAMLKLLLETLQANLANEEVKKDSWEIPVGISNRHIHLSKKDLDILFGEDYKMTKIKDLSQPGQYACKETLTICGPKGAIEKVRILGPIRSKTQVEVLAGDCFSLGVAPHTRLSGNLCGTPGITLIGPKGSVQLQEGLIVAQRHIHMTPQDAKHFDVQDGQIVSIQFDGLRGGIYNNVAIRANDDCALECHIDIDEANAMIVNSKSKIKIVK